MPALPCRSTWRTQEFKEYNFKALGQPTAGGHLHPLLKVNSNSLFIQSKCSAHTVLWHA